MMKQEKISSNMEDYLEAIVVLKRKNTVARVKDICKHLNVKASSVNSALNTLSEKGFVIHEKYGYVDLTEKGEALAKHIKRRHDVIAKFLTDILNIDYNIASEDACKMEHILSPETFQKLTKFIEFVETCPAGQRPVWLESFDHYFKTGKHIECKIRQSK